MILFYHSINCLVYNMTKIVANVNRNIPESKVRSLYFLFYLNNGFESKKLNLHSYETDSLLRRNCQMLCFLTMMIKTIKWLLKLLKIIKNAILFSTDQLIASAILLHFDVNCSNLVCIYYTENTILWFVRIVW